MKIAGIILLIPFCVGCAMLFGWDIHAPGILSQNYYDTSAPPIKERVGLYIPQNVQEYVSRNRGGRLADPQVYHIGEAYVPMLIEAFQNSFGEFIFFEVEPTNQILSHYAIPYLVVVDITDFENSVKIRGQAVSLRTELWVFDTDLNICARFEATGTSDAQKVFAKRGGPEVNLNAAIENNITISIHFLRDLLVSMKNTP